MTKGITGNALTEIQTQYGSKPFNIIKIEWASGDEYYCDQVYTFNGNVCKPLLITTGSFQQELTISQPNDISTISILLSDADGSLKELLNIESVIGTECTVYQHYDGLADSNVITLMKGKLVGDATWLEHERHLSLSIESRVEEREYGYIPAGDSYEGNAEDAGQAWPLAFGTVIKVPAIPVQSFEYGRLLTTLTNESSSFIIDDNYEFPRDESIIVLINGLRFSGSITEGTRTFIISQKNVPAFTNIAVDTRENSDFTDASECWITGTDSIQGFFCHVNHATYGNMVNYCVKQEGQKCTFLKSWTPTNSTTEVFLDAGDTISEVAKWPRTAWNVSFEIPGTEAYDYPGFEKIIGTNYPSSVVTPDSWQLPIGSIVRYRSGDTDIYVCNQFPATQIHEVCAYREVEAEDYRQKKITRTRFPALIRDNQGTLIGFIKHTTTATEDIKTVKSLEPIPSSYYTKHLSKTINGYETTAIEIVEPLEEKDCEKWDGSQIFVSFTSTLTNNTANAIKWLIETYTALEVDTASFESVALKLTDMPSNFCLFDVGNVLELCKNIAWQARCALIIRSGVVFIRYLSETPTSEMTADNDSIMRESLIYGFSSYSELVTRFVAIWSKDYTGRAGFTNREYHYQNNEAMYGSIRKEFDFFIYNSQELVELSATFWGYRYSNVWRTLRQTSPLSVLDLETLDCVTLNTPIISNNILRSFIQTATHNTANSSVELLLEIASKDGDNDSTQEPCEDVGYWAGDPNHLIDDYNGPPISPAAGLIETDYVIDCESHDNIITQRTKEQGLYFVVILDRENVTRETNFLVDVYVYNNRDRRFGVSVDADVTLNSTDDDDIIDTNVIRIRDGHWQGYVSISNGTTSAKGVIQVSLVDEEKKYEIQDGESPVFYIDGTTSVLEIVTAPDSDTQVVRGTTGNFGIKVTGPANQTATVSLASSDQNDKLYDYDDDSEIATITFDGDGDYEGYWYIDGGSGDDNVKITVSYGGDVVHTETFLVVDNDDYVEDYTGANAIRYVDLIECDSDGNVVITYKWKSFKLIRGIVHDFQILTEDPT